jgi:hypothetical protein
VIRVLDAEVAGSWRWRSASARGPHESTAELAGPVTGVIRLPLHLNWSERTEFHLDDPAERNVMLMQSWPVAALAERADAGLETAG